MPSQWPSHNSSRSGKTLAILSALASAIEQAVPKTPFTDSDLLVISNCSKMAVIYGCPKITVTWDSGG